MLWGRRFWRDQHLIFLFVSLPLFFNSLLCKFLSQFNFFFWCMLLFLFFLLCFLFLSLFLCLRMRSLSFFWRSSFLWQGSCSLLWVLPLLLLLLFDHISMELFLSLNRILNIFLCILLQQSLNFLIIIRICCRWILICSRSSTAALMLIYRVILAILRGWEYLFHHILTFCFINPIINHVSHRNSPFRFKLSYELFVKILSGDYI